MPDEPIKLLICIPTSLVDAYSKELEMICRGQLKAKRRILSRGPTNATAAQTTSAMMGINVEV